MFPLLFLVLMVPLPDSLLDMVVTLLQRGSFWAAYSIFKMLGVDASSKEYVVFLPGLSIEVARQCSGIRSALSLFVTSLVAGHLFLKGPARKVILALASFPIAIFKNGLRIVVLSLGAIYVDEGFLSGPLHRRGGIVFFLLSLALLALTIWLLRRFGRPEADGGSN
jgi:exosortase